MTFSWSTMCNFPNLGSINDTAKHFLRKFWRTFSQSGRKNQCEMWNCRRRTRQWASLSATASGSKWKRLFHRVTVEHGADLALMTGSSVAANSASGKPRAAGEITKRFQRVRETKSRFDGELNGCVKFLLSSNDTLQQVTLIPLSVSTEWTELLKKTETTNWTMTEEYPYCITINSTSFFCCSSF